MAPPAHVRIKTRDFVVVVRADGRVQALDRQGGERHVVELRTPRVKEVLQVRPGLAIGTTRVVWRDSVGALLSGTLDGALDTLSGGTEAWLTDVDADGERELLLREAGSLSARRGQDPLWQVPVEGALSLLPVPGGGSLLCETDLDRCRWIASDGGEPLAPFTGGAGSAAGDLNLDGRVEVVTVSREGRVQCLPLGTR